METTSPSIALQLYTVRQELEVEDRFESTLEQIARFGYRNVELAGFYGRSPEEFHRVLTRCGLKACSSHESLDGMENDLPAVIDRARLFGYSYIAVPWLAPEHRTLEGYRKIAARLKPVSERLKAEGITLLWHNHDFEFHKLNTGELPEDILLGAGVDPELDVYWVWHAGHNPHDQMTRYSGRIPILHIKDMQKDARDFAEVGTGILDLPLYVREAPKHGVQWLVVEQDSNWAVSPLESARVSLENLKKMMV
jgi:sugar phosphate isomerase/epimerase